MKIIENLINHTSWNYSNVTQNSEKHFQFAKGTNLTAIATTPAKKNPVLGHKYYGRCYQKSPLGFTCTDARFEYYVGDNVGVSNLVFGTMKDTKGEWERLSSIQQLTSTPTTGTWITRNFVVSASNLCYRKELMIIDLTEAFGAGNEPTLEWCDEYLPYIENRIMVGTSSPYQIDEEIIFNHNGSSTELELGPGKYKLECWGGQGGYRSTEEYGGKGGYAQGILTLSETSTKLYIYPGGSGNSTTKDASTSIYPGGFNGGGYRYNFPGGGGGSDVRIGTDSLYARVIVAGGGGSCGASSYTGGAGGGDEGGDGHSACFSTYNGTRGTQTGNSSGYSSASQGTTNSSSYCPAGFGFGGFGVYTSSGYGGAGGGGWYGGQGVCPDGSADDDSGGGGGSGYIYTSATAANYPSGCLLTPEHYLSEASMTGGVNSGDGSVKITVIEVGSSGLTFVPNNNIDEQFIPNNIKVYFDSIITNEAPTPPPSVQTTLTIKKYNPFNTTFTNVTTVKTTSFTFKEWNTRPNGGGTAYLPGDIIIYNKEEDFNLYAIWNATDTYSGIDVGLPTYDGHDFLGWSINSFNDKNNLYIGSYIYLTEDAKALYPVFEPRKIRYVANGGNCPPVDTYLSGSNFTVSTINNMYHPFIIEKRAEITLINGLKREQIYNTTINTYTFSHWNTMPDGSGTSYNPGVIINSPTSSLILYAIWTKTSTNNPVLLPTPTKTGLGFNGWGENSTAESGIKGLYDENTSKTLYATWNNQAEKVSYKPKIFQNDAWK